LKDKIQNGREVKEEKTSCRSLGLKKKKFLKATRFRGKKTMGTQGPCDYLLSPREREIRNNEKGK